MRRKKQKIHSPNTIEQFFTAIDATRHEEDPYIIISRQLMVNLCARVLELETRIEE